jgi:hypothetical protein
MYKLLQRHLKQRHHKFELKNQNTFGVKIGKEMKKNQCQAR